MEKTTTDNQTTLRPILRTGRGGDRLVPPGQAVEQQERDGKGGGVVRGDLSRGAK